MKIDLNGKWTISSKKYHGVETDVPGSVLGALLEHKLIEDPYYRLNESEVRKASFEDFDFERVAGLTIECRQKLKKYRPLTIAQASRISGVSPADISVLLVYFGR